MQADIFVKTVFERGQFASRDQARQAIAATLEAFAARLPQEESKDLVAQLPEELKAHFAGSKPMAQIEKLSLTQFCARIAKQLACDEKRARSIAQAVTHTLQDAVSGGEMGDVRQMLSKEFEALFRD